MLTVLMCAQLFFIKATANGFQVVTSHNDGKTVATVSRREGKDVDHYVGLLATTDSLTESIAIGKGYTKTKEQCMIDGQAAYVLLQHRLINMKS